MTGDELRRLAASLSVDAGELAHTRRRAQLTVATKSSLTDLVTEHDRAAEALLVERLRAARPGDAIIGEEGAAEPGSTGFVWYLDPIDGTTNYVYGHPLWATSVAVADTTGMLAGAVYAPASAELFTAARGEGATLDGEPIAASSITSLDLALVATGFGYAAATRVEQATRLAAIIGHVRDVRRGGSAALDLCYVASGRVDAYYETGLNIWDSAAGELIAREAGCTTSSIDGGAPHPSQLCVAAPGVFEEFRVLVHAAHR